MALLRKQPLFDWRSYAEGRFATGRKYYCCRKRQVRGLGVWSWTKSLCALLAPFRYASGQLLDEAGIDAFVDSLVNRMRQVFIRRSLFE